MKEMEFSFKTAARTILTAVIVLARLSVVFKAIIVLLPVALVLLLAFWLYAKFTGKKTKRAEQPLADASSDFFDAFGQKAGRENPRTGRKPARDVTTKDVDE